MTKLTFLGTGEAFDPDRANTSYLIETDKGSIMVDCGYTAPQSLMAYLHSQGKTLADSPDALLLTHFHGDHAAGIPALLIPMFEEINGIVGECRIGKKRKLEILSRDENIVKRIQSCIESDYPGAYSLFKEKGPDIFYREVSQTEELFGLGITYTKTSHSVPNHGYRFWEKDKGGFAISGDGAMTYMSKMAFKEVGILIHEAFNIKGYSDNHASMEEVINYAVRAEIPKVAFVHINRAERQKTGEINSLKRMAKEKGIDIILPNDHDSIEV